MLLSLENTYTILIFHLIESLLQCQIHRQITFCLAQRFWYSGPLQKMATGWFEQYNVGFWLSSKLLHSESEKLQVFGADYRNFFGPLPIKTQQRLAQKVGNIEYAACFGLIKSHFNP